MINEELVFSNTAALMESLPKNAHNAGHFYVMLICPELSKRRIKMGFARKIMKRKKSFATIAPTIEIVKTWPCLQEWEKPIIEQASATGCKKIGREVFDCDSVNSLISCLTKIFDEKSYLTYKDGCLAQKRSSYIRVMLTEDELKELEAIAKAEKCDTSAWVRAEIFKVIAKRKKK